MQELRDVVGYEGLYVVSDDGDVFRKYKGHMRKLSPIPDKDGYLVVSLSKENKARRFRVHRIVAMAFLKPENDMCTVINHKDEDKANNKVENLEWCTQKYNTNYNGAAYRRWDNRRKPIRAIAGDESHEFSCITEACETMKVYHGNVSLCLQGKRKTTGGFRWEYMNP